MNQPCATIQCGTPSSSVAMSSGANQRHDPHRHHRCRLNRHLPRARDYAPSWLTNVARLAVIRAALIGSVEPPRPPCHGPTEAAFGSARPNALYVALETNRGRAIFRKSAASANGPKSKIRLPRLPTAQQAVQGATKIHLRLHGAALSLAIAYPQPHRRGRPARYIVAALR
jgi:hypothetical protein